MDIAGYRNHRWPFLLIASSGQHNVSRNARCSPEPHSHNARGTPIKRVCSKSKSLFGKDIPAFEMLAGKVITVKQTKSWKMN